MSGETGRETPEQVPLPVIAHACCVCGSSDGECIASGTDYQYRTTDLQFDWKRCGTCGHLYIDPVPAPEALSRIYPDDLKNYEDFDRNPGLAFRVKSFLDGRSLRRLTRSLPSGSVLLDVGCAAGMLLDTARRYCPNLEKLEGMEISQMAAARARQKGYKVEIGRIEDANLPSDYYDIVMLQQVIEHVHDPRAVLEKIFGSLKSGGILVMETPHLYSLDHLLFMKGRWEGYHIPRHFNLWTVDGMERMVRDSGFSDLRIRKKIKPVHWTISFQNYFVSRNASRSTVRFFDLRNPMLLAIFGMVDLLQLLLAGRASDVQYVATK